MAKKTKYEKRQSVKKGIKTIFFTIITVLLVVATLGTIFFYLYTKESMDTVTYPKSPLSREMNLTYSYIADETLPVPIRCPSIPVLLNVGGTERSVTENGCVFSYQNDTYISVYEVADTAYSILSEQFVSDIYAGQLTNEVTYVTAGTDVGYFNGYPSEYQYGSCKILSATGHTTKELYLVSLTLDMKLDKKIMVVVSTADRKKIYDAGLLLQSIGYTIMDASKTGYIEGEGDDIGKYVPDIVKKDVTEDALSQFMENQQEEEPIEETVTDGSDMADTVSGWISLPVEVKETYPQAYFILEYANTAVAYEDILLYDELGKQSYVPTEQEPGRVKFFVTKPGTGRWTVNIKSKQTVGEYTIRYLSADETTAVE